MVQPPRLVGRTPVSCLMFMWTWRHQRNAVNRVALNREPVPDTRPLVVSDGL